MNVRIRITGGHYEGRGAYEGPLSEAPTTSLVPEGIASARTIEEARRLRLDLARLLETHERVELTAVEWRIVVERVREDPHG